MAARFQTVITLPPKSEPYTQHDMDVVIGHPVNLSLGIRGEDPPTVMSGTIISAEILDDGSAAVTLDVTT